MASTLTLGVVDRGLKTSPGRIIPNTMTLVLHSHNKMAIYLNLLSNKTAMISRNLDHQKTTSTHALFLRVSE
jgi:hypothetical protein